MIGTTQGWCWGWMTRNTLRNDSTTAALLGMRNVEHVSLSTWQSGTTNLEGNYLAKTTSMGPWIIREGTASERSRKWSAGYSSRNDPRMAALLGFRDIVGSSTRQFGTWHLDGHYLTKATSVCLTIVEKATTLGWCWRWIAWNTLGNYTAVAALLVVRNIMDVCAAQPGTLDSHWNYLIVTTLLTFMTVERLAATRTFQTQG